MPRPRAPSDPFRWFDSSPEVIRYVIMLYVRYPLSLRNVEEPVHNHFNQERTLVSRATYKERRSAALAEWRTLAE